MHINYYKTYLQTIKNSLGSTLFQEFYIDEKDILNQGAVGCAYYVSNILKQFNLTPVGRANVDRVVSDLEKKWWTHLPTTTPANNIPAGSVLVREASHGKTYNKMHKHIWFYIGDEQAISNNSIHFTGQVDAWYVPVQHHYTYNWQRPLTHILTRDRDNPFADWLYHYELPIDCIQWNDEETLRAHWLTNEEITFRLGKDDWLEDGRLCGPTSVLMSLAYFGIPSILQEYVTFADTPITYTNAKTGQEKTVSCFTKETWWYHSWLIHIAKTLAEKKATESTQGQKITASLGDFSHDSFLPLLKNVLINNLQWKKTCLITSVSPYFDVTKNPKWGHLIVVAGIDYNWYETTLIVCDPLEKIKKQLSLSQFLDSCSGKYFILQSSENL